MQSASHFSALPLALLLACGGDDVGPVAGPSDASPAAGGSGGAAQSPDAGSAGAPSPSSGNGGSTAATAAHGTCFAPSDADAIEVSSAAALESAVNAAPAGRQILVAPGTYAGGTLTFSNTSGTATEPVVVRPRDGFGTVTFTSPTWQVTGARLVLSGLQLTDAQITLRGQFNRLTRSKLTSITRNAVVVDEATDLRIDHCDFSEVVGMNNQNPIFFERASVANGNTKRVSVDYNHFHDIQVTPGDNGMSIVVTSTATGCFDKDPEAIIDHCLFQNIEIVNEGEVISVKNSGTAIRYSTFVGVELYLSQRTASHNEVRSCWFENMKNNALNIWGDDHLVIGNRFVGDMHMRVGAGDGVWDDTLSGGPIGIYAAARKNRIIGNSFDTGTMDVGGYWSGSTPTVPAQDNIIEATSPASAINLLPGRETGTVIKPTSNEPYVAAVKLTPADVGVDAPDPLCN
jgi:hypothetical protein